MGTFENASHSFVERLFITMAFKLTIGAFLTVANKSIVSKKGLTTPFCWSSVNTYRFIAYSLANGAMWTDSVFINKKG